MRPINLIPSSRINVRRRRAHRQRCVLGCSVYACVVIAAGVTCHVVWGSADPRVSEKLDAVAGEIERTDKTLAGVKAELDAAQSTLKASRSIVEQPDWSALMALLAAKAGDEVVLRSCTVKAVDVVAAPPTPPARGGKPKPAAPPAPTEPSLVLFIAGLGQSQMAVSQFALRLEGTRLFAKVRLIETNRETLGKAEVFGFRIECSLDDPNGPAGAASRTATVPGVKASAPPAATTARPGNAPVAAQVEAAGPVPLPSGAVTAPARSLAPRAAHVSVTPPTTRPAPAPFGRGSRSPAPSPAKPSSGSGTTRGG